LAKVEMEKVRAQAVVVVAVVTTVAQVLPWVLAVVDPLMLIPELSQIMDFNKVEELEMELSLSLT
jgi:short subunit fatty acids transporter